MDKNELIVGQQFKEKVSHTKLSIFPDRSL